MLDLDRLRRIHPRQPPWGQIVVANFVLALDYRFPRPTRIDVEGEEHLPRDRRVFLAMNHTDKYNYWPFEYVLYRKGHGFCASWVKGKYYENKWIGWFMDQTTNIPLPSRGYVLTTEFRRTMGRAPDEGEYRALREAVGSGLTGEPPTGAAAFFRARGGVASFAAEFGALFDSMIAEVLRITREAFENGYHVLVFPQGTRSKRLSRGHTGMMQVAQALGVDVLPIGCSGNDKCYPDGRPFSRGGHVVYRVGPVLRLDGPELGPYRVRTPFAALTDAATAAHDAAFQAATDVVMDRINGLLDPEYRFGEEKTSDGVKGVNRFL